MHPGQIQLSHTLPAKRASWLFGRGNSMKFLKQLKYSCSLAMSPSREDDPDTDYGLPLAVQRPDVHADNVMVAVGYFID